MPSPDREQTLALAGVMLALSEVRDIATQGHGDTRHMSPCLQAVLGQYEGDVAALYGGIESLTFGLRRLADHFSQPQDHTITRYMVSILQLERRLAKSPQAFARLRSGLERARSQLEYFGDPMHVNMVSGLSQLYSDTLSTLRPRIMVHGERNYLEDERNAALVRALLLSAVRATALWRHAGGSRFRLILRRQRTIEMARWLLTSTL